MRLLYKRNQALASLFLETNDLISIFLSWKNLLSMKNPSWNPFNLRVAWNELRVDFNSHRWRMNWNLFVFWKRMCRFDINSSFNLLFERWYCYYYYIQSLEFDNRFEELCFLYGGKCFAFQIVQSRLSREDGTTRSLFLTNCVATRRVLDANVVTHRFYVNSTCSRESRVKKKR